MRIAFDADADSLSVVGGIEDDAHGYSANIPLGAASPAGNARTKTSLASTGMMAGKQDPMMGFPDALRFEPYAYFRNIGDSAIHLSSSLYYDHNGKARSSAFPELLIPPHQSRELAISEALRGIDASSVTLAYSYTGTPNALIAATGSVDQTGNYVFEVEPRGVSQTASKSAIYWLMGNGFDTMYSLWNPSNQPQDLLLTFRYGVGQTYEHPMHLQPSGTAMVDIMQLAQMGMPDRNGHELPLSATEGSLIVSAGNGSEYDPISVAVAGGIYNPKTATCNPTCETCNGCASFPSNLTPNPFGEPVANSGWLYSQCSWYNGTQYTYNNNANWSSNNGGVATVQTKGQSYPGLTYGAGAGSATISSFGQSIPTNAGQICGSPGPPACPVAAPAQSGPANISKVPAYMLVEDVEVTTCDGCAKTVAQFVTYGVKYADGSSAGSIPICESPTLSNQTCSPQRNVSFNKCGTDNGTTDAGGSFEDEWSIATDTVSPIGCGFDLTDKWQWYQSAALQPTFATLTGYVHTNAVKTNGYTVPPQSAGMPTGFKITP